jgi:hypothetical protein
MSNSHRFTGVALLLAISAMSLRAQTEPVAAPQADGQSQANQEQIRTQQQLAQAEVENARVMNQAITLQTTAMPLRLDGTKTQFQQSNREGWDWVAKKCVDTTTDICAQASIVQVYAVCSASGKWFKKDNKAWRTIGFAMVIASAVFTGVGASTTIANAKVFSTLGGTTGLGAVSATVTANEASDQAGLASVNTAMTNFQKFIQTGGNNNQAAPNNLIFKSAPTYAAQCAAAAQASNGTAK